MARRTRGSAWWLVAAVVVPAVVVLFAFGLTTGSCYEAADGADTQSYCTSGPMVGLPGAWILSIGAAVFALYALLRLRGSR
ncbi:MAG: hypothetical protein ABWY33_05560 [Cellulomonas sp.]